MRQFQRRFCLQISLCGKCAKGTTLGSACCFPLLRWRWFNSPLFMGWFVAKFRCWESGGKAKLTTSDKQNLLVSAANTAGIDHRQATAAVVYQQNVQGICLDISIILFFTSELMTKILAHCLQRRISMTEKRRDHLRSVGSGPSPPSCRRPRLWAAWTGIVLDWKWVASVHRT